MNRTQFGLGMAGSALLVAIGVMHGLFGWPEVKKVLATTSLTPDVVTGFSFAWELGGAATAAIGLILMTLLVDARRGIGPFRREPLWIAGVVLLIYAAWTFASGGMNAVGVMAAVPALLLCAAAWRR